ncbi:hypothetical protein AMECASPLE_026345 [Ameca splendens]|uniref:Uncharacterized protein n=1 Tax=Ameca splendens TaxID=208324 RepID=A0ABV0XTT7_9TELE
MLSLFYILAHMTKSLDTLNKLTSHQVMVSQSDRPKMIRTGVSLWTHISSVTKAVFFPPEEHLKTPRFLRLSDPVTEKVTHLCYNLYDRNRISNKALSLAPVCPELSYYLPTIIKPY